MEQPKQHKHSTIAFALGFLEDHVENNTEPIAISEEDANDEKYVQHVHEENEHREQLRAMMKVLSEGLTQLMHENITLNNKILLAKAAL
jgi:hypothetical protein